MSRKLKLHAYNTILRPVVTYAAETSTMILRDQLKPLAFQNKVLNMICGPTRDPLSGKRRRRINTEVRELLRFRRPAYAGHAARTSKCRAIKKIYETKAIPWKKRAMLKKL